MPKTNYNQSHLIDTLIEKFNLKSDAALARTLDVNQNVISKMRNEKLEVGATMLLNIH